jgi:hypothetical protein
VEISVSHHLGTFWSLSLSLSWCGLGHECNISAVKRVEFVSDRMSYVILRGHWYDIVLSVQTSAKYDTKGGFYKELKYVLSFLNTI